MTGLRARVVLALFVLAVAVASLGAPAAAHNEGIPSIPLSIRNMAHVANVANLSGNALDFFERQQADGTIKRYAVAATQGNGFDILDITDPTHPITVGRYLLPDNDPNEAGQSSTGSNFHAWVSVNPLRNIVALTVEEGVNGIPAGRTVRHGGGVGIQFVDITNVANPKPLGKIDGIDGPHTVRMIGNSHAYTSMKTWVVDYSDPMNPTASQRSAGSGPLEGHEFYEDPNIPGQMYAGLATTVGRWGVFNVDDPANPSMVMDKPDNKIAAAHEVYPSPDSSYVGVADFTTGQTELRCPGGGIHFYDITGKHAAGASIANPVKLGVWHAPYTGLAPDGSTTTPNHASCTMHSWQHQPERSLAVAGLYAGGTWIFDSSQPTQPDGPYAEYDGTNSKTTWGNTLGHVRDAGDYVNATQWLPFDLADPDHERLVYVHGSGRGLDVYRYTGPLPLKQSRLRIDATASGGAVTGTLDRYAVLTHEGWTNLPLTGATVTVSAGGQTVTTTTRDDGTFTAPLALSPGAHRVTASWAGDERFAGTHISQTVDG